MSIYLNYYKGPIYPFSHPYIATSETEENPNSIESQWQEVELAFRQAQIDFNHLWKEDFLPLTLVIQKLKDLDLCQRLIASGADFNTKDKEGRTPLLLAIGYKEEEIATFLIQAGVNVFDTFKDGSTLLHQAAGSGLVSICELLVKKGLDVNSLGVPPTDVDACLGYLSTELPIEHFEALKKLVKEKGMQFSPLIFSIIANEIETTRWLLANGANCSQINSIDFSPLFMAIKDGKEEIAKLLVTYGANVNEPLPILRKQGIFDSLSLLTIFIEPENKEAIKLLLQLGADFNQKDFQDATPVKTAILLKKADALSLFIQAGLAVNQIDSEDRSYLQEALQVENNTDCISLLLQAGANVQSMDQCLNTPLNLAFVFAQAPEIIQDLKIKDKGLADLAVKLKLLGHRFGIRGEPFEGISPKLTLIAAIESLEKFIASGPANIDLFNKTHSFLQTSYQHLGDVNHFVEQMEKGLPSVFMVKWIGHAITVANFREFFFKANRGNGSGEKPGFFIYKIGNSSQLKEATRKLFTMDELTGKEIMEGAKHGKIAEEMYKGKNELSIEFFNKGLDDLLDLQKLSYFRQSYQPSGNCVWISAKELILLALIISSMHIHEPSNLEEIEEKVLDSMIDFKEWSAFDRSYALKQLQEVEESPLRPLFEKVIDFNDINKAILFRSLKKSRVQIIQTILDKDLPALRSYKILLEAILAKDLSTTLSSLANLSLEEINSIPFDKLGTFCCKIDLKLAFLIAKELPSENEKIQNLKEQISYTLLNNFSLDLDLALTQARKITNEMMKIYRIKKLVNLLMELNTEQAISLAKEIPREPMRTKLLKEITEYLIPKDLKKAHSVWNEIPEKWRSSHPLNEIFISIDKATNSSILN